MRKRPEAGLCCREFTLPYGPEELWENYEHFYLIEGPRTPRDANGHCRFEDIEILAETLRYVGFRIPQYHEGLNPGPPRYRWTCSNFDQVAGRCGDYENRSDMCRSYPRPWEGCEWAACESEWCGAHPINAPSAERVALTLVKATG